MTHLELLAETIKLEGIKPMYFDNASPHGKRWSPIYNNIICNIAKNCKIKKE